MLSIEENRDMAFCTYCGAKVIIHNDNEHIIRKIDEAGIKKAEVEQNIRMKELELEEKRMLHAERSKAKKTRLSILLVVIGVLMMVVGGFFGTVAGPNSAFWIIMIIGLGLLLGAIMIWTTGKNEP